MLRIGFVEYDSHWNDTLSEAAKTDSSTKLRYLFAIMLLTCGLSNPEQLWENHKDSLSEDVHRQVQQKNPTVEINYTYDIYNRALILLEDLVLSINGKALQEFDSPSPVRTNAPIANREILKETNYCIRFFRFFAIGVIHSG